jgi:hypothetical protein
MFSRKGFIPKEQMNEEDTAAGGKPGTPIQNWHDRMLVLLVSVLTPAFHSESKTFKPAQFSQQDGPLHKRDQSSTTRVVEHHCHPFLQVQDIIVMVSFRF